MFCGQQYQTLYLDQEKSTSAFTFVHVFQEI